MILAISAASAADIDDTSDSDVLSVEETTVDEVVSTDAVDEVQTASEDTEVLTDDGDASNFTALQYRIDSSNTICYIMNDYKKAEGDDVVTISKDISIIARGGTFTIDANNNGGIFKINTGVSVYLSGVTLVNGNSDYGAAIYNEGDLVLDGCTFSNNVATQNGGAIYNTATLDVNDCILSDNIATYRGGAIYNEGTLTVTGSTIDSNDITFRAKNDDNGGAAIYNNGGTINLDDVEVTNNLKDIVIRDGNDGHLINAVIFTNGNATIDNSYIANNTGSWGAGVYVTNGATLTVSNTIFEGNNATFGAGIYDEGAVLNVDNCTFNDNLAIGVGSAGTSSTQAGAILVMAQGASATITNSRFNRNSAKTGGAVSISQATGSVLIDACEFTENTASYEGGAIYNYIANGAALTVTDSTFTDNTATNWGNAISNDGDLSLSGNTISGDGAEIGNWLGEIDTQYQITILDGQSHEVTVPTYQLTAIVTDDNGNKINDHNFIFLVGDEEVQGTYYTSEGMYIADYTFTAPGTYVITTDYENAEIINSSVTFIAALSSLKNIIDTAIANGETSVDLSYGFQYYEPIDGVDYHGIVISEDFTINGNGLAIDGGNAARLFNVSSATLTLNNITLTNGKADEGAAVYVDNGAKLDANDVTFSSNIALDNGGAIYTDGGEITLTNCVLDANDVTNLETSAAQNMGGAAIYAKNSQVTLVNTNVTNNGRSELDRSNGDLINAVINLINSDATITGGLFENNTGIYGGAIYAEGDGTQTLTVTGATFNNNKAYNGGAIDVDHGMITTISDSSFNNNLVVGPGSSGYYGAGGAIAVGGTGSFSLTDSNFTANQATGEGATGGAVHVGLAVKDAASISGCEFTDNSATDRGSAIFNHGYVSLSDNVIDDELGIYSNGEIDSQVFVIFMDNEAKTFDAFDDVNAYAKVVDDNGNIIKVDSITLVTTGFAQGFGGTIFAFNETDNLYHAKLVPTKTGIGATVSNPLKKLFSTVTVLSQTITVNPVDRILEVTYENITEGNPLTVNVKLTRAKDGALLSYTTVTIIIGNVTKSVSTRSGVGSVTFDNLTWGNYVINASVKGSSSYNPNEELNNLTVSPVKGTFTDLQYIIDNDELGLVFLPYDFKYDPNYDSNLTNGVVINKNLYIIGNDYTIDANNSARIFNVTNGAIFKIDDATLTNGRADYGGAIYVDADSFLNTQYVVLYNNTATYRGGAIYSEGTVDVMDSVLDGNDITFRTKNDDNGGAAIYNLKGDLSISNSNITNNLKDIVIRNGNAGDLLVGVVVTSGYTFIEDSYFANNTGSWGGAISSLGYMNDESYLLSIKNSKFEGNNATFGGAIFVESSELVVDNCTFVNNKGVGVGSSGTSNTQGGAIVVFPDGANAKITDSTFTANSANTGGAVSLAGVDSDSIIENCTFTDNTANDGGAVYLWTQDDAVVTVANSTFTGNTAGWGNAISTDGTLALSNNTISGTSADIGNWGGSIISTIYAVVMNNGTYSYHMSDITLNATVTDDNGNLIKDRNIVFTIGDMANVTATYVDGIYTATYTPTTVGTYVVSIEEKGADGFIVNTSTITISKSLTDLAKLINDDTTGTITLDGDYAYIAEFDEGLENGIVIDKNIIIDANGSTISGSDVARLFHVAADADLTLKNATLINAKADKGAAVYVENAGQFEAYNVTFFNNTATYKGGAVYSEGSVNIVDSVFDSNDITFRTANDDNGGAAVYNYNGVLSIVDSNITNNLKDIVIRNGNAGDLLVGVVVTSGETVIRSSYFANNTGSWGGAISSLGYMNTKDYTVTVMDSKFEGNNATFGGAIFVESANLIVENSTFENNKGVGVGSSGTSNTQGGAIIVHPAGSSATITDSTFIANSANIGGAVSLPGVDEDSLIDNCTFIDNTASADGGALYFWTEGAGVTVKDSEFVNNTAPYGGAIENEGIGDLTVDNCIFTENTASARGGAIISSGNTDVSNSVFTDNEALGGTNAIYLYNEGTTLKLSNNTITGDTVQILVKSGIDIVNPLNATFLGNQTVPAHVGDIFILNATLTDDNGNFIYDADLRFSVDGETIDEVLFDDETGLYTVGYYIGTAGPKVISTNYELDRLVKYTGILDVPKANITKFTVLTIDTLEGENATIWITLIGVNDQGLNSTVTVIVNNKEYAVPVENGEGNLTVEGLTHGQYPVVAMFDDPSYNPAINSSVFFVKGKSVLNITELTVAEYGDVIEIAINLTGSDGKSLTGVVVVDETITVLVENGIGTFVIDTQPDVGNYTFQAVYDGDNDYFSDLAVFNVTVNTKVIDPSDIVVDIPNINEFSEAIPITITSPVDGTYTVNINGTPVDVEVVNGTGSANITLDKAGIYNATVDIAEEGYSLETITTDEFEYLVTPEFNVEIIGTYPEAEISITGPAGTYHVIIDGMEPVNITREESGLPTIKKIDMDAGNYTAYVSFDARDEYYGDYKEINFTVNKATLDIAEPEVIGDKVVDAKLNITFTLPADVDPSTVTAFMDGVPVPIDEFVINETTGVYTLPLDGFSVTGGHLFTVQVNDPNYEEDAAEVSFLVEKVKTDVTIKVDESEIGVMGSPIVNITVSNNATGYIVIDNDGTVSVVEITNGTYSYQITDLTAGDYYINVTFLENDKYLKSNATVEFNVSKSAATPDVVVITPEIKGGEAAELNITMDNEFATGNVRIYVDGAEVDLVELDEDYANATVVLNDLTDGTHTIGVKYLGNDNFNESNIVNVTVTVVKADSKVTIDPIENVTVGNPVVVYYTIENRTGDVTVSICYNDGGLQPPVEDVDYVIEDDRITINSLAAGDYVVIIFNNEDEYYNDDSDAGLFSVNKADISDKITIEPVTITYGENATVIVNGIPDDATGNVTVKIGDKNYTAKVEDGDAIVEISGLAAGTYEDVAVEYSGDDVYNATNARCAIYVDKAKSEVTIYAIGDQTYPGDFTIGYDIENETKVNITVYGPNGDEISYTVEDGKIVLTDLAAGEYSIIIVNNENENFTESQAVEDFKVVKANPIFTSDVTEDAKVGENVTITVKAPADGKGNVSVSVDGELVAMDVPVINGAAIINVTGLDAGHHSYEVTYYGDDNYETASDLNSFDVAKAETTVTIEVDGDIGVTGDATVNITVSNNATGYIVIDDNGDVSVVEITNGTYSFEIFDLTAGDYYINVTFLGNDNYLKSNATKEFNIPKSTATPEITDATTEIKGGQDVSFNVAIDDSFATGDITVYVNGEVYDIVDLDDDAKATVTIDGLTNGTYTIGVKYNGDEDFDESEIVNFTVTVTKADSKVTIDSIDNMTFAIPGTISYSIDNETDVNITIVDANNTEIFSYDVDDGLITVYDLDVGTYTITIVNKENGMYKASNATAVFNVVENPDFSLNITNPENSTDTTFTIHVPEDAEGYLLVDVDGKKYYAPIENGTATVSVPGLAPGNYSANITYTGDDSYPAVSATADFTVPSNVPDNALTIPETSETTSPTYSISLPSDATGYLEVDVDGTKYVAPLVNGSASITVPGLSEGNHNVTVSYTGDGKYSSVSKDTTLNVHVPVYAITQNKNINVRYSATANYRVLITKDGKAVGAGETVSIRYNGKTYTVRTDSNGYATLKLNTKVKVKKYTITATYKGITVKNTVKVKNIIKAKNKKVKKSRKVTKVRISLLKVNGKVLKNKKIKVKFRYKWYKVKTNKKGVGYFKVKKSMLKKLKVGKKYKYRVTYGKDVVTKKLTIKR